MKFYIDTGTGTEAGLRKPLNASRADLLKAWYTSPADVAGRWTTTIPGISEDNLVDGLTIRIRLGTSYNNNYNTLNINGLGPKLVYYRQNELLTNHVAQYAEVLLTYRTKHVEVINGTSYSIPGANTTDVTKDSYHYGYDGWVLDASYSDGNDYDRLQMKYERARIGDVALKQYKFCMFDENGHLYPISTGSGTSGHEPVTVGLKPNRILYLNSSTTNYANAYAVTKDGDLYESLPINKLLYTFNSNIPAYSQLYLVGSIGNNGLFYLDQEDADSFYIYVTPPSDGPIPLNTFTAGKYYIFVGASSGTAGNFQLSTSHTLYYCADASEGRTLTPVLSTTNVIATNIGALYTDAANKTAQWGTLPVVYGGTGMTSNPSMRINLSSTSATNVFQSSPKPGVEGILSVANGGTGKATLDSGKALIGNGADAVTLRNIYTKTSAGTLDWASANNEYLVTKGAIAYWNGAYAGTSSNIAYVSTIKGGTWQGSTVAIAYGGTGMTSNPSMRINLSSTSAANVFQASPKPGVEGILGINNGGTGGASANAAIKNLALGLDAATDNVTDNTVFIGSKNAATQTDTWYRRTGLQFWNYIKGKTDTLYAAKSYEDIVDDMKNVSIGINTDTSGASGPTITISTGQYTATSAPITSATTSLFGVTKLSSAVNSSSEALAATAKAVKTAYDKAVSVETKVNNLDVTDTADSTKYVSEVDQTDGKIAVTRAAFNPSVSLGDGTDSAGPTIAISVAGNSTAATPISKATTAKHGVTILTSTVDTTTETKAVTPKGVSAAITALDLPNTYLKLNGTNNMGADVNIIAGDTDKFVNFWYDTNRTAGASWRLGMLGSGSSNTNYFVIQSGTSTTSNTVWKNALRIGQNNLDVQFSGHVTPSGLSLNLGSESYPWKNVYGETFHGNATTASKFNSTRKIELTGAVTGSDTKDGSSGWTIATTAKYLDLYEARGTTSTLNKAANYGKAGAMFHLIASSSTGTTDNGKPPAGDANVLQMNWDNNGGYDAQLAISTADSRMEFRSRASQKTAWREVVTVPAATPATGSGLTPVYINSSGQVVSCDTSLLTLGTTATTAAAGNHTHSYLSSISWASSSNKIQQSVNGGTASDVLQFVAGGGTTLTGAAGKLTITSYRDPGYGKIAPGAASTADTELTASTINLVATTYNETLTIKPANKWIVLAGTNSNTANADILEIAHSLSGATAGSYGNSANQTPAYGGTFNVPYITVDKGGHITAISNKTVKIPASDNQDTKVEQGGVSANAEYNVILKKSTNNTNETSGVNFGAVADKYITVNPSLGRVSATQYRVDSHGIISYNSTTGCLEITTI